MAETLGVLGGALFCGEGADPREHPGGSVDP